MIRSLSLRSRWAAASNWASAAVVALLEVRLRALLVRGERLLVDLVDRVERPPPLDERLVLAERPLDFEREPADERVPLDLLPLDLLALDLLRELLVLRRLEPPLEPDPDPARLA
jgi:hypothetical protein